MYLEMPSYFSIELQLVKTSISSETSPKQTHVLLFTTEVTDDLNSLDDCQVIHVTKTKLPITQKTKSTTSWEKSNQTAHSPS